MLDVREYLVNNYGGHSSRQLSSSDEIALDACPNCGREEDHFNYNVRSNVGGCFSCGFGIRGVDAKAWLVVNLEGISFTEAKRFLLLAGTNKLDAVTQLLGEEKLAEPFEKVVHENTELPEEFELVVDQLRNPVVRMPDYFDKRLYAQDVVEKMRIGFCTSGHYASRMIFPFKCKHMKSFVARRIHDWMKAKYKNPPGSKHSQLLYNYESIKPDDLVFVCEGVTDVIRLACYDMTAVCTFGKKISMDQINLLSEAKPKEVIALFDGDAIKQNQQAFEKLSLRMNASFAILPRISATKVYDPDSIPLWILQEIIGNRMTLSKLDNTLRILQSF